MVLMSPMDPRYLEDHLFLMALPVRSPLWGHLDRLDRLLLLAHLFRKDQQYLGVRWFHLDPRDL